MNADPCLPEQLRGSSACFLNDATRAWAAEMQPAQLGMPPWHIRIAAGAPAAKRIPRPAASRATMASSADELSTATVGLLPGGSWGVERKGRRRKMGCVVALRGANEPQVCRYAQTSHTCCGPKHYTPGFNVTKALSSRMPISIGASTAELKRQRAGLSLNLAPRISQAAPSASLPAPSPELSGTSPCHSCGAAPEWHSLQITSLRDTSVAASGAGRANSGSNYPTSEPGTPQGGRNALLGPQGSAVMDFSLSTYDVTSAAGKSTAGHALQYRLGPQNKTSLGPCNSGGSRGSPRNRRPQACCSTSFSFPTSSQAAWPPLTGNLAAAAMSGKAPRAAFGTAAWGGTGGSFGSGVNLVACDEDAFPSMGMGMPLARGLQCPSGVDPPTRCPEMVPGDVPILGGDRGCPPSQDGDGLAAAGFVSSIANSAGFPSKGYSLDGPGGGGALRQNSLASAGFGITGFASKGYGASNMDTPGWSAGPSGGNSSAFGTGDLLAWRHPDSSAGSGSFYAAGASRFDPGAGPSSSGGPSRGPAEPTPADDMAMFDGCVQSAAHDRATWTRRHNAGSGVQELALDSSCCRVDRRYLDDLLTFDELLMPGGVGGSPGRPMSPFGGTCAGYACFS